MALPTRNDKDYLESKAIGQSGFGVFVFVFSRGKWNQHSAEGTGRWPFVNMLTHRSCSFEKAGLSIFLE